MSNPFSNSVYVFSRASVAAGGASVAPARNVLIGLLAPNGMVIGP